MKKYIWLLPIFLFACKKEPTSRQISTRQQPSRIDLLTVNTLTGAETPLFSFVYDYNESANRFDSITTIAGSDRTTYVFDYSKLDAEHRILLNYTDSTSFSEYTFDNNNYTLTAYRDHSPVHGTTGYTFLYDGYARITRYDNTFFLPAENFFRTYSYHGDSIIVHTQRPNDNCISNDTIFSTLYDMNYRLPYLFFTDVFSLYSCGTATISPAIALPFSNFVNKLPLQIQSGNVRIEYTYAGDQKSRLAEATITRKNRNTGQTTDKVLIRMTY